MLEIAAIVNIVRMIEEESEDYKFVINPFGNVKKAEREGSDLIFLGGFSCLCTIFWT